MIAMANNASKRESEARLRKLFSRTLSSAVANMGWNGNDLAKLINITNTAVYDYMAGRKLPSLHNFVLICDALECDADALLGRKVDA